MKNFIIKIIRNFILCIIGLILSFTILLDIAYYYDTLFLLIVSGVLIILIRFLDDYMRDTIIILRDNQTLVATVVTAIITIGSLFAAYLIFTNVLNGNDIIEIILNFVAKFVDVSPVKNYLGI